MSIPPAGIPRADWEATPPSVAALLLEMIEQNQQQADQIAALATRIAQLEEQKGRSSRNSSQPPSSEGAGGKPRGKDKAKGSGRQRGGQKGHPGRGRDLLASDRCDKGYDHLPDHCGSCGTSLSGAAEGAAPWRHQIVDIPPVTPIVIEHRLHQLL